MHSKSHSYKYRSPKEEGKKSIEGDGKEDIGELDNKLVYCRLMKMSYVFLNVLVMQSQLPNYQA